MDTTTKTPRKRISIECMTPDQMDKLVRAWAGIQKINPNDPVNGKRSFFTLGGYHGEPFRGAGWGNSAYWGGYCNHGNVLFPTWHRVYLLELENALRSINGCEDVTIPFWDQLSENSLKNGLPPVFTEPRYKFTDGSEIANPLYSYKLQKNISDHRSVKPVTNYSKPKGYATVRYPLSGLVGTEEDRKKTKEHNEKWKDCAVERLNKNIVTWLTGHPDIPQPRGIVSQQYRDCLKAPNYTVFSNTTSAAAWNDNHRPVVSLESPHNSIHLAIGGFDVPSPQDPKRPHYSPIRGANGDMGENETASFDPIFFFHHCFIDLVFWLWQLQHEATCKLDIMAEYPGTNSVDEQGPTPGTAPNSWLDDSSPLDPFKKADGSPYTSRDCADIAELGYCYEYAGELSAQKYDSAPPRSSRQAIYVTGIDRTKIKGSFLISAFAKTGDQEHHIGTEAVLSRWHVEGCANCQTHLRASAVFPLPDELTDSNGLWAADSAGSLQVRIRTHTPGPVEDAQTLAPSDDVLRTALTYATADGEAEIEAPLYAELRDIPDEESQTTE